MRPRKIALLCVLVGALCLPAPLYLGWAADAAAPPPQTSQVYAAQSLNLSNESARETVVHRHGTVVAISVHQVSHRYSAGEYRAPNETRATLRTAMETGRAEATDPAVRADLRAIARNDTFVYDAYGESDQYYRLTVADDGATVRASPVPVDRVANVTVDRTAANYSTLSAGERRTVDRILANSTGESWGYRPRVDDPFVDRLPGLVYRNGTLYSLYVAGHVDDFGSGFAGVLVGVAVAAVGALLVVVGAGVYAVVWWRDRR